MRIHYLVDTDWTIDYLLGVPAVTEKLTELKPKGLAISIITMAEILEGVYYSKDPARSRQGFDAFLEDVPVLEIDEEIAKVF
jgi:tRNA(fMet)-specific endonuclease VapC